MNNKFIQFTSLVLLSVLFSMTTMAADMTVGEKTYQQACAMCHASGVANAPVLGKKSDWVERNKKDNEALVNSAINGLGAMPAKGGQAQLSDSDVAAAVDFMLIALDKEEPAESAAAPMETKPLVMTAELEKGKAIVYDRSKGNCLACHQILDGDFPGDSGPPLNNMKVRFPDKQALQEQIADATIRNPETYMPPYGRHQILSAEELVLVTDFIHAL